VATLLVTPIDQAEAVLRGVAATRAPVKRVAAGGGGSSAAAPAAVSAAPVPAAAPAGEDQAKLIATLNERGRALCSAMTPMLGKFPFAPEATNDATIAEVAAALAPGSGALWAFQQERLTGILEKQGNDWIVKPDARVGLSAPFVTFFNRAAQVSQALFGGAAEPHVALTVHASATPQMPTVTLTHGTTVAQFDRATAPAQLVWPPASGRTAKLSAVVSGRFRSSNRVVAQASGDWALFRLAASAPTSEANGGTLHLEWPIKEENVPALAVDFNFPSGFPVLKRGWLGGMACTPQVTK
jgi:type VI secretion system protein ImpL